MPINSQFYFSQNQFLGEVLKAPKSRKGSSEKKKKSGAPLSIVACVVVFFFVVVAFFSHVYCTTYRVGVVYCVLLAAVGVYVVHIFIYSGLVLFIVMFFFPTMSNWKSGVSRKGKQNGHDKWWTFTAKCRPCVNSTTAVDAINTILALWEEEIWTTETCPLVRNRDIWNWFSARFLASERACPTLTTWYSRCPVSIFAVIFLAKFVAGGVSCQVCMFFLREDRQ